MRIQYASDLHLDLKPVKFRRVIKPVADILILAGDIGHPFRKTFELFLGWCADKFKHVLFIPGNQEYHGSSLKAGREKIKKICKTTGVIFMERKCFVLDDEKIIILGTTLWSYIPQDKSFDVLYTIDDYKSIKDFSLDKNNNVHLRSREWLKEQIQHANSTFPYYKIVVVTHHAPISKFTSSPRYRQSPNLCAYSSDCRDLLELGVDIWIFGHTHYNTTFKYQKTIVTSNQRGDNKYQKDATLLL